MDRSEASRVKAVQSLDIIGSYPETEFDRIAKLAGHISDADYSQVCFIDATHQFIKAYEGAYFPPLMPRENSICLQVILSEAPILIPDLSSDQHPHCREIFNRHGYLSYVGLPIRVPDGHVVGAVAALSQEERSLSGRQIAALEACAELAGREAVIRKAGAGRPALTTGKLGRAVGAADILRAITMNNLSVLRSVSDGVIVVRADGTINFANPAAEQMLGRLPGSLLGLTFADEIGPSQAAGDPDDRNCPVAATLRDGAERLVRSASFRRPQQDGLKVGYVVSPVVTNPRPTGAVVVFHALEGRHYSNGVELRSTLREVGKLKEQLAKLEASQQAAAPELGSLPPLGSRTHTGFGTLLEMIREEQMSQLLRAQAACGGSGETAALLGVSADQLRQMLPRAPSGIEHWLAQEQTSLPPLVARRQ